MKSRSFIILALLLVATASMAQGLKPPSEGKAVVYFTRLSPAGFAIPFDFFDGKKFIGDFAGRNYMVYECEPGEHLFWSSSENREFMTSELKAGDVYVVIVDVEMGLAVARVGLKPISVGEKDFEKAKKLIDKKEPKLNTQEELDRRSASLGEFITESVEKYETKFKETRKYKHLSPEMAIPAASF